MEPVAGLPSYGTANKNPDFAAVARACGARGIHIKAAAELGPALREALASGIPTVIQVPMENVPTPTPGHWNINDIYRNGQ